MNQQDIYSQRLKSYDTAMLQYNLACEDLVRAHLGKVHKKFFRIKSEESRSEKDVEKLSKEFSKLPGVYATILSGYETRYFLAKEWTGVLSTNYQFDEGQDAEEKSRGDRVERMKTDACEEGPTSSTSGGAVSTLSIRSFEFDINTIDTTIYDKMKEICVRLNYTVLIGFEVEKGIPVTFAFPGAHGIDYYSQSFEGLTLKDVEQNYSGEVLEAVRAFLKYAQEVTHGILLISGPVGTGKSYLIRAVLTELKRRRAIVCTPPSTFLIQAGLLAQVVANFRKSIIVLEDVGDVIAIDSPTVHMDARANLLNFSEGFLSLLTDALVVLSFNYELSKIDPAIVRPGRCLGNINVDMLPYAHVTKLIPFEIPKRAYSLAEVYEMRRVGNTQTLKVKSVPYLSLEKRV